MKNIFLKYLPPFLLIILTIYIFRGVFSDPGLLVHVDTTPLNFNMTNLQNYANFLWHEKTSGIGMNSLPLALMVTFVTAKIYGLIHFITKDPFINNVLWVYLPYPVFVVSAYAFVKLFVKNGFLAATSVLFYIFSAIFLVWFFASGSNFLVWALSGCMWFSWAFINILDSYTRIDRLKYLLVGAVASLFAIINIAYFYVFILFLALYFLLQSIDINLSVFKNRCKNVLFLGLSTLGVNLFWILPIPFMAIKGSIYYNGPQDVTLPYSTSCATPIRNLLYMYCGDSPSKYLPYALLVLTIFVLISWRTIKEKDKLNVTLLSGFIFFYLISLGTQTYLWKVFMLIPGSILFRVPQRAYMIMILLFITLVAYNIEKYRDKLLLVLFLVLLPFSVFYYRADKYFIPQLKVNIPKSYQELQNIFSDPKTDNYRIAVFPKMKNLMEYKWIPAHFPAPPMVEYFLSNRLIMSWYSGDTVPTPLIPLYDKDIIKDKDYNFQKILGLLNVQSVLYLNDIRSIEGKTDLKPALKEIAEVSIQKPYFDTEELKLFRLEDRYVLPMFYIPDKVVRLETADPLRQISEAKAIKLGLLETNLDNETEKSLNEPVKSTVNFTRKDPTLYEVSVTSVNKEFLLVFQESYQKSWELSANGKRINAGTANHLVVNQFANGWVVNSETLCAENKNICENNADGTYNFKLIVSYWPQKIMDIFVFIAYLQVGIFAGWLGVEYWKKYARKSHS